MSAASTAPGALPAPEDQDSWLDEGPWLAGDRWLDRDDEPLARWLDGDPERDDPDRVAAWLDRELERAKPWLEGDPEWADPPPAPREVFKAGRWDRSAGTGGGFAAGGVGDRLPPGPVLAGLAGDAWTAGLGRLTDDELIGVLLAARRLSSWAAAMELAAVGELWQRRTAEEDAGDTGAALHADSELAAALTLTRHAAEQLLTLAVELRRLPATRAALAAGNIDLPGPRSSPMRSPGWPAPTPPAGVLAADAHLTALAAQLKRAGAEGTMDCLRAQIYLALLTGTPASALLPTTPGASDSGDTSPGGNGRPATPSGSSAGDTGPGGNDGPAAPGATSAGGSGPGSGWASMAGKAAGRVNLTVPLATWLGQSDTPGQVAGYGPLDATDSRALAQVLGAQPSTKWCITFLAPDGRPAAHGCARAGPLGPRARDGTWTFTITWLNRGQCDHAWKTDAYEPSPGLWHLVQVRHTTCTFPGCRRPAIQCDADHTLAYDRGGRTCLCNLAPTSRI